ncbi:MAG: Uma2 family endonuclease [Myxococcales bacterium]|nr:Uma2 family endonuclease [Myxococcales bacterium]
MTEPARRRATYDDLLAVPEHLVAEILDGELVTSPRPAARHSVSASVAGSELLGSFHRKPGGPHGPGGWWILHEPELHLGQDVLVPDLAGWRRERMPAIPDVAAFDLAPDWICEVLSASTERLDRTQKLRIYAREGVRHCWLINPVQHTLEVYRQEHERWLLLSTHSNRDLARAEPFDAIELDLSRWWLEEDEPPGT